MQFENFDYSKGNYPVFSIDEIDRNRFNIVNDAYWNARNLKSIIEASYDTTRVYRLDNRKEEIVFSLVALTCELYLKSLAYLNKEQKQIVKEHDLESLFSLLSDSIKASIKSISKQPDFEKSINENKAVFIHFRYSYEMKGYKINATFLLSLMNALSKFCDEFYPKEITEGNAGWYKVGHAANGVSYRIEID